MTGRWFIIVLSIQKRFMTFTPRYTHDGGDVEADITFTKDEFYDLIYAAREAEIRFKRLRTKTWSEQAEAEAKVPGCRLADEHLYEDRIMECNENIKHFKAMEAWLKVKYLNAFGED